MATIDVSELRTRFSYFVRRAEAGEEFVVMRRGQAVAKLVAANSAVAQPVDKR